MEGTNACKPLKKLVAGRGFEPLTFGLWAWRPLVKSIL